MKNSETKYVKMELNPVFTAYLAVSGSFFIFTMILLIMSWMNKASFYDTLFIYGIFLALFTWVRMYRLRLMDDCVTYRSLFGGTKTIRVHELESVYLDTSDRTPKERSGPPIKLRFDPKVAYREKGFYANAKVFGWKELQEFISEINKMIAEAG